MLPRRRNALRELALTASWLAGKLANMKATIDIPDDLYREAKVAAAMRGTKVKELVAEGLRLVLFGEGHRSVRKRTKLPVIESGAPGTLKIPDDVAAKLDTVEDTERYASSMR